MKPCFPLLVLVLVAGCGDNAASITSPTPIPQPSGPVSAPAFTGTVTETLTGAPVAGFTAAVNGSRVTISAPGYVTRETRADARSVDLIREQGFDIGFYRQFARDAVAGTPRPLRVLSQAPSFYMEVEGAKGLSTATAALLERVARRLVPELTGGRFQVTRWEKGPTARTPQAGWIVIERRDEAEACGRALVGASAGQIFLDGNARCRIDGVFAHELGHALGFTHVADPGALMAPNERSENANDWPTEKERRHAAIAYARTSGNRDVDIDP